MDAKLPDWYTARMLTALIWTVAALGSFVVVAYFASIIAKRHHYYEDPDEDSQGHHH
jgi:hypothetical protein